MKKTILINTLAFILPLSLQAKELFPASTLKINSPDGLTSVKDLSVSINVYCRYKSGIIFPESKTCGSKTQQLKVNEEGVVQIPAAETFSGLHAAKTDNYDVTLSVNEGKNYLAVISARGKDRIKKFAQNKRELNILRFKAGSIAVSHEGQDFFGSELSKNKDAYVLFSIKTNVEQSFEDVLVVSSLNNFLWSGENKNIYAGKTPLSETKSIEVPATSFAYLGEVEDLKLKVHLNYLINTGILKKLFEAKVEIPATNSAIENIGTLDLK